MTQIFDGRLYVHYGQAYVLPNAQETPELPDCFQGQTNGLCGAALAETLFLMTGLHTGHVQLSIDVLDAPPTSDQTWEDVVEVPLLMNREVASLYRAPRKITNASQKMRSLKYSQRFSYGTNKFLGCRRPTKKAQRQE